MSSQGPHQDGEPKNPPDPTKEDLEAALTKPVATADVSQEQLIRVIDQMTAITQDRLVAASKGERQLSPEQQKALLATLKIRFEMNRIIHENIQWSDVEEALLKAFLIYPEKLWTLLQLEVTGGEPDVLGEENGEFIFGDCSAESPSGRRNVVFDEEAEEYAKKHYPNCLEIWEGNATIMVNAMGADFMDGKLYCELRNKLSVDSNTWSWLKTRAGIRETGYALASPQYIDTIGVVQREAYIHNVNGAFRAVLRVPKA